MTELFERRLGRSGLEVAALGLGTWPLGGNIDNEPDEYAGIGDDEALRAVYQGVESGLSLIDTADIYGLSHSERALQPVLKDYPEVLIATKVGNSFDEAPNSGSAPT